MPAAAERAGITYRQLDHWIDLGLVVSEPAEPGMGVGRSVDDEECEVVRWMAELVRLGVDHTPASQVAHAIYHHDQARLGLFTITPAHHSLPRGATT